MNTPSEQNANAAAGNTADKNLNSPPNNKEPQFTIPEPLPGLKPATSTTLHLATPSGQVLGPMPQAPAKDPVLTPSPATKGNSEIPSQPQKA